MSLAIRFTDALQFSNQPDTLETMRHAIDTGGDVIKAKHDLYYALVEAIGANPSEKQPKIEDYIKLAEDRMKDHIKSQPARLQNARQIEAEEAKILANTKFNARYSTPELKAA